MTFGRSPAGRAIRSKSSRCSGLSTPIPNAAPFSKKIEGFKTL